MLRSNDTYYLLLLFFMSSAQVKTNIFLNLYFLNQVEVQKYTHKNMKTCYMRQVTLHIIGE